MDYERLMVPLEYRADDSNDSPGVLTATLMTYGQRGRIRPELFEMGALHWGDDGIVIRELHPPKDAQGRPIITTPPIMRGMPFLENRELKISAPAAQHHEGPRHCRSNERSAAAVWRNVHRVCSRKGTSARRATGYLTRLPGRCGPGIPG